MVLSLLCVVYKCMFKSIDDRLVPSSLILCGCASQVSPPSTYPPSNIQQACLKTGVVSPLEKKTLVLSDVIGTFKFTCNVDSNNNPYQDCLNTMAAYCNTNYMRNNATRITKCKSMVNTMVSQMADPWKNVLKACGQWSWDGLTGDYPPSVLTGTYSAVFKGTYPSEKCNAANTELQKTYYVTDAGRYYVTKDMVDSVNAGLWKNTLLKE